MLRVHFVSFPVYTHTTYSDYSCLLKCVRYYDRLLHVGVHIIYVLKLINDKYYLNRFFKI